MAQALEERREWVHVGGNVKPDAARELAQLARERERSVSAELRVAVAEHLRRNRKGEGGQVPGAA